jgi:hypothetical protein
MHRSPKSAVCLALVALTGCLRSPTGPALVGPSSGPSVRRIYPAPGTPTTAVVSSDTDRDMTFGGFLIEHSGGRIARAAVGIEKAGMLRVDLDRSAIPDDVLGMTRTLMDRARGDFPDRSIHLAIFDPGREPILKVQFRPGQGVRYQIAHPQPVDRNPDPGADSAPAAIRSGARIARSAVTGRDREFADWASEQGRAYLHYLEVDLEHNGRIWFGVGRQVKPADLPGLTRLIMERARDQFPGGDLKASVFDPEGERIGKARVGPTREIHWEK